MWTSAIFLLAAVAAAHPSPRPKEDVPLYANVWAVEVEGGESAADALAAKYGFVNRGQIGRLVNMYEFVLAGSEFHQHGVKGNTVPYQQMTTALQQEVNVKFAQQQKLRKMVKKGYQEATDPLWPQQWYLLNTEEALEVYTNSNRDLNVEPAWIQGVTGCNVIVGIVDDGVEYTHPDLENQYLIDQDLNAITGNDNAFPGETNGERDSHGTSCAGIVAMEKSNRVCGVGVAYQSRITGIRLITEGQTDAAEARALSHLDDIIQIYSNSWGPSDLGFIVQGPDVLSKRTFEQQAREGRNGYGSIYVWAAGNGGDNDDSCGADGYVQSIYTIAIGSVGTDAEPAFYDERCSAKLASTFVTNPFTSIGVATTTSFGGCTTTFDGTSAATPVASGAIALTLEANPDLSWRDIQYLIAYTSNIGILNLDDVATNGAGLQFSHYAGFGAIDAEAMVTRARHWANVPEQQTSVVTYFGTESVGPNDFEAITITYNRGTSNVGYLEHVVVQVSTTFEGVDADDYLDSNIYNLLYDYSDSNDIMPNRGDIQLSLRSPSGTVSTLLPYRNRDSWPGDYEEWPFMSVHFWGEDPSGNWTLYIVNRGSTGVVLVSDVEFTFYGTQSTPAVIARIPTVCDPACARGCAASGPQFCDACREYRNATTLECVSSCAEGLVERSGYCYDDSEPEPYCNNTMIDVVIPDSALAARLSLTRLLLGLVFAMIVIG